MNDLDLYGRGKPRTLEELRESYERVLGQLRDARYIIDRYQAQSGVAECDRGHRYLKNWSDFCPLCRIDALSSGISGVEK